MSSNLLKIVDKRENDYFIIGRFVRLWLIEQCTRGRYIRSNISCCSHSKVEYYSSLFSVVFLGWNRAKNMPFR